MKPGLYKQCKLITKNLSYVAWIPVRFAVNGKQVTIKSHRTDGWNEWTVSEVWASQPADVVEVLED